MNVEWLIGQRWSAGARYGFAAVACALTIALLYAGGRAVEPMAFASIEFAVFSSALVAGRSPGALATLVTTSVAATYGRSRGYQLVPLLTAYLVVAAMMLVVADALRTLVARERELRAKADAAVRARDLLVAVAAHELKTPLTTLQLQTQRLLRDATLSESTRVALVSSDRAVRRLGKLIDQMLDIARVQERGLALELSTIDLGTLAAEVVARVAPIAAEAGSTLSLVVDPDLVGTWDEFRLDQALTNLMTNAVRYGAGKPVEVICRGDAGHCTVTVVDHGIGIAREEQPRIFERFARASSVRHYGGLGLGLWITKRIVERMGGTITVASDPGRGATFVVRLPRVVAAETG